MITAPASLSICLTEQGAILRLTGRASFQGSVDFRRLVLELAAKNRRHFVLDLEQCTMMDSTFLGVLVGLAVKKPTHQVPVRFDLFRPTQRVLDLLDNLGLVEHFGRVESLAIPELDFTAVQPTAAPGKIELAAVSLEAHQDLMKVNPDNVPRFKDVVAFMAEDLKQLTEAKHEGDPAT